MENKHNKFAILGTAIGHGQPKPGVERAYEYLELVGFFDELKNEFDYENFGTLEKTENDKAYNDLYHKTQEILQRGFRPLLIGGDHSQAFASISAICTKYPDLRILWIDAHADMNTLETTPSGNSHGMPLSGLFGLVDQNVWGMPWMNSFLKPAQIIHLGVRDIDAGEKELIKKLGVEVYNPTLIRKLGLQNILNDIAKRWEGLPVHLSFDIDGLDQSLVPATGTPVGNGLTMEEAKTIIDASKKQFNLVSSELVEFNPDLANTPEELYITEKNVKALIRNILSY